MPIRPREPLIVFEDVPTFAFLCPIDMAWHLGHKPRGRSCTQVICLQLGSAGGFLETKT